MRSSLVTVPLAPDDGGFTEEELQMELEYWLGEHHATGSDSDQKEPMEECHDDAMLPCETNFNCVEVQLDAPPITESSPIRQQPIQQEEYEDVNNHDDNGDDQDDGDVMEMDPLEDPLKDPEDLSSFTPPKITTNDDDTPSSQVLPQRRSPEVEFDNSDDNIPLAARYGRTSTDGSNADANGKHTIADNSTTHSDAHLSESDHHSKTKKEQRCYNCKATETSRWLNLNGKRHCSACKQYFVKFHISRPPRLFFNPVCRRPRRKPKEVSEQLYCKDCNTKTSNLNLLGRSQKSLCKSCGGTARQPLEDDEPSECSPYGTSSAASTPKPNSEENKAVDSVDKICSNCGTDETSCWRRGKNGEQLCNACISYEQKFGIARPIILQTTLAQTRVPNAEKVCENCKATEAPRWYRANNGGYLCKACKNYELRHGERRPLYFQRNLELKKKHELTPVSLTSILRFLTLFKLKNKTKTPFFPF
jgi:hypothetical protein